MAKPPSPTPLPATPALIRRGAAALVTAALVGCGGAPVGDPPQVQRLEPIPPQVPPPPDPEQIPPQPAPVEAAPQPSPPPQPAPQPSPPPQPAPRP